MFLPGQWDIPTFLFSYTMIGVFPLLFIFWKILKKTKWLKPEEVDLYKDVDEIEEYQRNYVARPPGYRFSSLPLCWYAMSKLTRMSRRNIFVKWSDKIFS